MRFGAGDVEYNGLILAMVAMLSSLIIGVGLIVSQAVIMFTTIRDIDLVATEQSATKCAVGKQLLEEACAPALEAAVINLVCAPHVYAFLLVLADLMLDFKISKFVQTRVGPVTPCAMVCAPYPAVVTVIFAWATALLIGIRGRVFEAQRLVEEFGEEVDSGRCEYMQAFLKSEGAADLEVFANGDPIVASWISQVVVYCFFYLMLMMLVHYLARKAPRNNNNNNNARRVVPAPVLEEGGGGAGAGAATVAVGALPSVLHDGKAPTATTAHAAPPAAARVLH